GIILAQGALHFVGIMAEGVIGLVWRPVFVITYMLLVVIIIVPLVVAFSHLSARRIKHLHPLNALRGGILTHNFKKNHMPLDKSRGSLNFVLALKQLLHNKKQTIMIGLIVAALTFVSIAGLAAHYNLNVNHEEFMVLIGGELPDVYVAPNRGEYFDHAQFNADFREQMATHPDVRFINGRLQTAIFADGSMLIVWATENMSLLETNTTIRGRYPIHANEIAINFLSAEQRGLDVGDWMNVEIGADGYDYKPFVITGITQGGSGGMITGEGLSAVAPDFDSWSFFIYLTADACIETFGDELTSAWGEHLDNIMFPRTIALMQVETIGPIFAPIAYAMVGVTAAVVILVLYMVIKTTILRRRRDLGIQKALGFTTLQLMNQISLSITPPLLIGIITGAISGYLGFNPIFSAVSRGMGIAQTNLPVPALWTIAVCLGLILLAYATSLAISWTIRKISAYALITE
ncbi:MAG: ABC transporter permease, partial [Defluviitaleaceae bacterium]|nr:ABC transporter permease [Defluviitaleaceae bacterium]